MRAHVVDRAAIGCGAQLLLILVCESLGLDQHGREPRVLEMLVAILAGK
jgi:hypothetical protein